MLGDGVHHKAVHHKYTYTHMYARVYLYWHFNICVWPFLVTGQHFCRLEDARRAVREKDRHHMGDRYVELFLLSEGGGVAGR